MTDGVLFDGDTELGHYQVVDTIYSGRHARVLYSGSHQAAQSGVAHDDNPQLLFDYNERFMELCRGLMPHKVLLIGGGACTLPKALLKEFPDLIIHIVELDGGLFDIAKRYFEFVPSPNTSLYVSDGREFLDSTSDIYDLIMIDAFSHATIPRSLQTAEAAKSIKKHLAPHGVLAMNIIAASSGVRSVVLRRQVAAVEHIFSNVEIFPASSGQSPWLSQNYVVTAHLQRHSLNNHFRYEPVPTIKTQTKDLLNDRND